jgi:hypothetical protein
MRLSPKRSVLRVFDQHLDVDVSESKLESVITEVNRRKPVDAINLLSVFHEVREERFLDDTPVDAVERRHAPSVCLHHLQILILHPDRALEIMLAGPDPHRPRGKNVSGDLIERDVIQVLELIVLLDFARKQHLLKVSGIIFRYPDVLQAGWFCVRHTRDLSFLVVENDVPLSLVDAYDLTVLVKLFHLH